MKERSSIIEFPSGTGDCTNWRSAAYQERGLSTSTARKAGKNLANFD